MKIGIFDSGVGGMTVLRELLSFFPQGQFIYFGDTANLPYGSKSPQQIKKLALSGASLLMSYDIQALIVACNTASSFALEELRDLMHPIPVFGMIEAGVFEILKHLHAQSNPPTQSVYIFSTLATAKSHAYQKALLQTIDLPHPKIYEQACPLLVPFIEAGWADHPLCQAVIQEYTKPLQNEPVPGIALLGCTHYPWIKTHFERFFPDWIWLDSAQALCHLLKDEPSFQKLLSSPCETFPVQWIFSDPEALPSFAKTFMIS